MNIRQTHTYAALEVSAATWDEIATKLRAAGYDHSFDLQEKAIDMQGIGLVETQEGQHKPDEDGAMNCVCDSSQTPAASMCERCPRREAAIKRDLECWQMLMELRDEEGSSVEVLADNVDFNSMADRAIECLGAWTEWKPRRFGAKTLYQALTDAVVAMRGRGSPA